jgi:SAM-dependent methyltransferase
MNAASQSFNVFLQQLEQLPFHEKEAVISNVNFILEDVAKQFPFSPIKVFYEVFGPLDKEVDFDITDKMILEIGPGFSLGVAFLAALSGALKVCAVDAYAHLKGPDHEFITSMLHHLVEERSFFFSDIKNLSDDDFILRFAQVVSKNQEGRFCFRRDKIELLFPYKAEKLPFQNDTFDLVYTSAAFEHFMAPREAVREMYRITKPGGVHLHSVDLRDHRNFKKPLEFLTIEEPEWQYYYNQIKSTTYACTNRLRSPEIIDLFEQEGFKTFKVLPMPFLHCTVKDQLFQRLTTHYKRFSKDELSILGCKYIFQK